MDKIISALPRIEEIHAALTAAGLASLLTQPLALHGPSVLQDYVSGRIRIDPGPAAMAAAKPEAAPPHPNDLQIISGLGIAVQPVRGIIHAGVEPWQENYHGLFNLDRIHHTVARIAGDPSIRTLVLRMDTPGGSVFGLHAAAEALRSLEVSRPDMSRAAYVQRLCASAGMYLAAATEQIHTSPGAVVGSIGTIASLTDSSGFWQKLGFTTHVFTADSGLKALGKGGVAVPQHHLDYMEETVREYSAEFKSWMKERRGIDDGAMQGQIFEACRSLRQATGMIDSAAFNTFEEFLAAGLL